VSAVRTAVVAIALVLVGCATAKPITGPDGRQAFLIRCSRDQGVCVEKAGEVCPRGYTVLGASGTEGAFVSSGGGLTTVTPTYRGQLMVQCRSAAEDE
jgi:hypothetical protein